MDCEQALFSSAASNLSGVPLLLLLLLLEKFCCADFAKADALKKGVSANLRLYDHNQKGGEPTKKLSVDRPEEDDDDDEAIEE